MEKDTFRSQFRLPWTLYERLKDSSERSGRSLNAEIVARLQASMDSEGKGGADKIDEAAEAVAEHIVTKVIAFYEAKIREIELTAAAAGHASELKAAERDVLGAPPPKKKTRL